MGSEMCIRDRKKGLVGINFAKDHAKRMKSEKKREKEQEKRLKDYKKK